MKDTKNMLLHWIIGTLALMFIFVFASIPMSEFFIVIFSDGNANRPIGESGIWFFASRNIFLIFNLLYGLINTTLFILGLKYLIRKQSANLLITFSIFFSIFFFLLLLTGNWLTE